MIYIQTTLTSTCKEKEIKWKICKNKCITFFLSSMLRVSSAVMVSSRNIVSQHGVTHSETCISLSNLRQSTPPLSVTIAFVATRWRNQNWVTVVIQATNSATSTWLKRKLHVICLYFRKTVDMIWLVFFQM